MAQQDTPVSLTENNALPARGWRMIALGCLTIIVAFAVLELTLRVLAIGAAVIVGNSQANPQDKYLDHPYLTTAMQPNHREVIPDYPTGGELVFETNSRGFRGPEFDVEKAPGVYRIVVVGGSAVISGRTNDDLFTVMLENLLADEFADVAFEVINAGVPGYTSTQELFLVETQILDWNPDLVLIYDGRNDMFEASMPDYLPYWNQRNEEVMSFLSGNEDVLRAHLFSWDLLSRRVFQIEQHPERDYNTPRGERHAYTMHQEALEVYASNLETVTIVLQGYGVQPAMAFQPILTTTHKPLSETEQAILDSLDGQFLAAQRELVPGAIARMGEVAERYDVPWIDLSDVYDESSETMFLDDVHQNDAGNTLIAQALFEMLEPSVRADLAE
jgi:lysophospholipase L1-like esterase